TCPLPISALTRPNQNGSSPGPAATRIGLCPSRCDCPGHEWPGHEWAGHEWPDHSRHRNIRHPVDRAIAVIHTNAHARGMFFHPPAREIRSQEQLQRDWQRIAKRSTDREPHLRCYFIEPGGRTAPKRVIYLSDVTGPLDVEQFAQFGVWAL